MIKRIFIIFVIGLLTSVSVSARGYAKIEVFDISKEAVVKRVDTNSAIQKKVESYLKGITNIYIKFKPIPSKGYMIKIPLEPPVMVKNQWLNSPVNEVILVFPEQGKPYLAVFDEKNKITFFYFEGNTDALLKELNFLPNVPG